MAFNPFNFFRRNQKVLFAVITVIIMFTFVLSSGMGGGADFFEWLPGVLRSRGEIVCTIDGSRVTTRQVEDVRRQRAIANKFMTYAAGETARVLKQTAQERLIESPTPIIANTVRGVLEGKDPQAMQIFQQLAGPMAASPNAKPQDRNLVTVTQWWLEVETRRRYAEANGVYFANAPNKTARDAVDFMLWERKADRMGIAFTEEDVKQLVRGEFFNQFRDSVAIQRELLHEYSDRASPAAVFTALAAEFRVRSAQTALLGSGVEGGERTLSYPPIFVTPFDLYGYYKDKTSPASYQVLAVPAASFAARITAEPSEAEVQRLFADRKDDEPDPAKEAPGFKEPRRVKVEWVAAGGDEPFYKKAAAEWVTRTEFFAKGGVSTLTVPAPGVGPAAWAGAAAAPMAATEPLVQAAYKRITDAQDNDLAYRWGGPSGLLFPNQLLGSSYGLWTNRGARTKDDADKKRPVYAAGPELAAQLTALGAAGVGGSSLVQPAAFYAQAVAHEARDRGTAGGLLFLAGVPGPDLFPRLALAEAGYRRSLPKPLPVEAVRADLLSEVTDRKARELAAADLLRLRSELSRLGEKGKARDKGAAAREFFAAFLKERGLKTGATADGVSEWTVRDDPALAPLREAAQKGGGLDPHGVLDGAFGSRFFGALDPQRGTKATSTGLYLAEFYPGPANRQVEARVGQAREAAVKAGRPIPADDQIDREIGPRVAADLAAGNPGPLYLAWRTDDLPAKSLPLAVARPRVVEAWRRAKARDEARAAADEIAARLKAAPGSAPAQFEPVMFDLQTELQGKFADPRGRSG